MRKKMTAADIITAQAETLLAGVNQLLLSGGKFAPAPKEPAGKRETVIGELTPFEKAVYTARNAAGDNCETIADANNRMVDESRKKGETVNVAKVEESKRMFELSREIHETLNTYFWASIRKRLGALVLNDNIGIREGYAIVQIPSLSSIGEVEVVLAESLALSLLEALGEGHRCDICDSYDECDLTIKKPR